MQLDFLRISKMDGGKMRRDMNIEAYMDGKEKRGEGEGTHSSSESEDESSV